MQSRNPFEPPKGSVQDVPPPSDLQTQLPDTVGRAFKLLIGSALLEVFSDTSRGMVDSLAMTALDVACVTGSAFLIRAGQNWARVVYLVIFVLGYTAMLFLKDALAEFGALYVALLIMQAACQGYALWLLFRPPGNLWFKRNRDASS